MWLLVGTALGDFGDEENTGDATWCYGYGCNRDEDDWIGCIATDVSLGGLLISQLAQLLHYSTLEIS